MKSDPLKAKAFCSMAGCALSRSMKSSGQRSEAPFPNATGGVHIRQDMYESTNGDWLLVETMLDSNAALGHQRHCNCWHYSSKAKVGAPFRFCEHVRAMYEHCGLPYQTVIGQVGEKA
ncbi:hypothetical protein ACBZ90_18360 (plasmid) [Vibrio alginolyticus]